LVEIEHLPFMFAICHLSLRRRLRRHRRLFLDDLLVLVVLLLLCLHAETRAHAGAEQKQSDTNPATHDAASTMIWYWAVELKVRAGDARVKGIPIGPVPIDSVNVVRSAV